MKTERYNDYHRIFIYIYNQKTNASRVTRARLQLNNPITKDNKFRAGSVRPWADIRAAQLAHAVGSAADEWPGWQNEFNATSSDTLAALPRQERRHWHRERSFVVGRTYPSGRQTTNGTRPTGHWCVRKSARMSATTVAGRALGKYSNGPARPIVILPWKRPTLLPFISIICPINRFPATTL